MDAEVETRTRELAEAIWRARPRPWRRPLVESSRRAMGRLDERPGLRSALFRFVDVAPACTGARNRGEHLGALLREVEGERIPLVLRPLTWRRTPGAVETAYGLATEPGTSLVARQFIAGRTAHHAVPTLRGMWRRGRAFALDLLGEASVTAAEADAYAARCERTLRELAAETPAWPAQPLLDADGHGPLPRVNLSIKLSALTPQIRASSPQRGADDAVGRLRPLLDTARELGAHVHLDMEDADSRETVLRTLEMALDDDGMRDGPSVGVVVQAYLRDADDTLDRVLASPALNGRGHPLSVRLVKGAYWDHERVLAEQRGWRAPVWSEKTESDACFERLTLRMIGARDSIRPAFATHNLRSIAHALAAAELAGANPADVEVQVLRGLGDDLAAAVARRHRRVRVYTPIGDLVAGMAYLVRRLLENSSNDGFLLQQRHHSLDELIAPPA